jgi:hypothetical protein
MVDQTTRSSGSTTDVAADVAAAGGRMAKEGRALSETVGEAKHAVAAEAHDLKAQAAERLGARAEDMKEEAAAGLGAFSDALKAASDELSGSKELGCAGDMVRQAAEGLEGLARALQGRSPGEMLEDVRAFGRHNPVGFIAGSVLAGFALGRVAAVLPEGASGPAATRPSERSAPPAGAGYASATTAWTGGTNR